MSSSKNYTLIILCVREPFFRVVAEEGPTLYGPWLLQQPPKTGSTWFVSFLNDPKWT